MSDQSGRPPRERSFDTGRRASADARQMSRSRLPLPPVPAAPARAAAPRPPAGPRTTMAPFAAVPSPEPRLELDLDDPFPSAGGRGPLDRSAGSAPAIARPSRTLTEEPVLASTGPGKAGGFRSSPLPPRVPRQTGPVGSPSPAYGDWTKPSRSGDVDELSVRGQRVPAPGTTAIPERRLSGRRRQQVASIRDSIDHELDADTGYERDQDIDRARDDDRAPPPVRGPVSGPVVGNRAAMRAERQAADMARRKREKQTGSAVAVLDELEADGKVRKPRRVVKGLLAMSIVALGVLGVYSFASPSTKPVATQSPAATAPAIVPDANAPLPALPTTPVDTPADASTAPVRAPITVLNATKTTGLAAKASDAFKAAGWQPAGVGGYTGGDVAASTVFFTQGDETQRQAAVQLVDAFPQLQGPTPRFFELPAGVTAPGLVVVLAADWKQP